MIGLISAFFASFLKTMLILRSQHLHQDLSHDHQLDGPQKMHTRPVPRIGGLSVVAGLITALLVFYLQEAAAFEILQLLILCAIPTFAIGLAEDISKKIGVKVRLSLTALSAGLFIYLLQAQITQLDIPVFDLLFAIPFFGMALTIFAITGLANAYNLIDGFNGLASMVGIITLVAITYIAFKVQDFQITAMSLVMIGSILGFFIWNYPRGLIFLGDGGAYLIGFWIAASSVLLVARHPQVSPWFALLVNGYPIMETLFTIYRRRIHQNKNPGMPDGIHFHTLIYRRILMSRHLGHEVFSANSRTAPYLWFLAGLSIAPAILWWQSTPLLMCASLVFLVSYVWVYSRIVKFKTPDWLHL
jgi:UDP-N-acetylmuramyl pentapeptide phosphotransferase/UDP-N-acetylglucosamine-1-phosphate transferase